MPIFPRPILPTHSKILEESQNFTSARETSKKKPYIKTFYDDRIVFQRSTRSTGARRNFSIKAIVSALNQNSEFLHRHKLSNVTKWNRFSILTRTFGLSDICRTGPYCEIINFYLEGFLKLGKLCVGKSPSKFWSAFAAFIFFRAGTCATITSLNISKSLFDYSSISSETSKKFHAHFNITCFLLFQYVYLIMSYCFPLS